MNRLKSIIVGALLAASQGIAAVFNRNVTAPHVTNAPKFAPAESRKRGFRTGIKGMASSNNTRYGATLKAHFDNQRGYSKARREVAA